MSQLFFLRSAAAFLRISNEGCHVRRIVFPCGTNVVQRSGGCVFWLISLISYPDRLREKVATQDVDLQRRSYEDEHETRSAMPLGEVGHGSIGYDHLVFARTSLLPFLSFTVERIAVTVLDQDVGGFGPTFASVDYDDGAAHLDYPRVFERDTDLEATQRPR